MTATWTATVNRNVGDTGSSSDINTYIGVNGNLDYLKEKAIQSDGSVAAATSIPMGNNKLTGLAAGTTAGDSVRYEQLPATTTVTQSDVTASRAFDGTVYHNTSGKIIIATITGYYQTSAGSANYYCDSNSSPSTVVSQSGAPANANPHYAAVTIVIPNGYYYKVTQSNFTKANWIEWTLF